MKKGFPTLCALALLVSVPFSAAANPPESSLGKQAMQHFEKYCFDCHDEESKKGDLDLLALWEKGGADYTLPFEHLITAKMPPKNK